MRTTIDIDNSVLAQLRERQRREHKTLGQLVSELLAMAMAEPAGESEAEPLPWATAQMRPRVDLEDRDAVHRLLDGRG